MPKHQFPRLKTQDKFEARSSKQARSSKFEARKTTDDRSPMTDHRSPITDYEHEHEHESAYPRPNTDRSSKFETSSKLEVRNAGSVVRKSRLLITDYRLPITGGVVRGKETKLDRAGCPFGQHALIGLRLGVLGALVVQRRRTVMSARSRMIIATAHQYS